MIIVPDEALSAYQTADGWKEFLSHIRVESSMAGSNIRVHSEDETMESEETDVDV